MKKEKDYTIELLLIIIVVAALSSCGIKLNNSKVIYSNQDSSFILIGGNYNHFKERAFYRAKKRATMDSIKNIPNN